MSEANERNRAVIEEFRANAGKVNGRWTVPLVVVTTTGAKTGRQHTTPVGTYEENGKLYVFASKGGAPENPAWYHNMVANPSVTVEYGTEKFEAKAVPVTGEERDRIYGEMAKRAPTFGEYETRTTRKIPVVELQRE
jgi:deazaflavin-dependent oxidoreductase (nitroreductase family)